MNRTIFAALASLTLATGLPAQQRALSADTYDLVITGARIIDGTGRPARAGDVGIRGRWIATVAGPGALRTAPTRDRLDGTGLVLAPGFVDVHSHAPEAMFDPARRGNDGAIRMGVTTVVGGPDGVAGPGLMRQFIAALAGTGAGTNVALYVGHNGLREEIMGKDAQRAPTPEELARMKAAVREGMELGAVGLSTGLMYEPGMWSTTEEVVELAKEVAPWRGIYDSHVREPVWKLIASDEEAITIGEQAGIAPKIGHEKAVGLINEGKTTDIIRLVNAARARGVGAVTDQYPYDGAATALLRELIVVPKAIAESPGFDLVAALRDPVKRGALKSSSEQGIAGGFAWIKAVGYQSMRVVSAPGQPALVDRYLVHLAEERKQEPWDVVVDLILSSREPVLITLGAIREREVQQLLVQAWNMVASDGEYSDSTTRGPGHPRSTGTFPKVLGLYARELKLLPLEEAVRKMTSFPADFVGLRDRGRVAEGQAADLVLFDPRTVGAGSTWDDPWRPPTGIPHVIVNGVPVLRNGALTGARPGTYLRARH
jgi:N-acyl-D-aspartate/D-glutamate deacylase